MSSRSGKVFVKWTGWNLKAEGAKKKSPIALAVRRVRQVALMFRVRPDVLLVAEVGSHPQAAALGRMFKKARVPLRIAPNGGGWRYAFVNPKTVKVVASHLYSMPGNVRYKNDDKPVYVLVADVRGYPCLFIVAHLENLSPLRYKVLQARWVRELAARVAKAHGVSWDKVFVYVDGNDKTGSVRRELSKGPLCIVEKKSRRNVGTKWKSHNQWKRRWGKSRLAHAGDESIDLMLSGEDRPYDRVVQHDTHTSSDHDAKTAVAVFI